MNQVPNLDKKSEAELWDFWKRYSRPTRRDAEALVGDRRKGFTTIAKLFSGYAANRAAALSCHRRGDALAADIYEFICDQIYKGLPPDCRWGRRKSKRP